MGVVGIIATVGKETTTPGIGVILATGMGTYSLALMGLIFFVVPTVEETGCSFFRALI